MDQRVVFVNSVMGLIRSMSNAINQGGEIDYQNVVRPALFAMGGNGALQYMQIMNQVLGLDNAESRANSRTNVSNWLRVVGREVGMEMRPSGRGYGTPTPITPHITRMQMAALADDPEGFRKAYEEAKLQAKEEGKLDPVKYVADAYQSRHPLKSIYRVAPTEAEYKKKILPAIPEDGRGDVEEAIRLYNRYGARLGVTPYEGKLEKKPLSMEKRERALEKRMSGNSPAVAKMERLERIRERALLSY